MTDLVTALRDFNKDRKFNRKGPLCVALVVTQHARKGLPLNPDGGDIQDEAERLGLVVPTEYDPAVHGDNIYADPGDRKRRRAMAKLTEAEARRICWALGVNPDVTLACYGEPNWRIVQRAAAEGGEK